MEVKKLFFVVFLLSGTGLMAQKKQPSESALQRAQKKEERREKLLHFWHKAVERSKNWVE